MYDETGDDGRRRYTVGQIATESTEFGVTRPTIYRHLDKSPHPPANCRGCRRPGHQRVIDKQRLITVLVTVSVPRRRRPRRCS